jgi:hypothetical protein
MLLNETMIGRAGEYLVCADLLLQGYRAFLCDSGLPYDVIVENKNKLIRVQVKTTQKQMSLVKARNPTYLFHVRRMGKGGHKSYDNSEIDIVALVGLDKRIIGYIPIADTKQTICLRTKDYQGTYRGEEGKKEQVITLHNQGLNNSRIASLLKLDESYVGRVIKGKENKTVYGKYIEDLTFEGAMECGRN